MRTTLLSMLYTCICLAALCCHPFSAKANQAPFIGEDVPAEVERMFQRGKDYLVRVQQPDGIWPNPGGQTGPAIQGLALMALIADGSDPRFGPYAQPLQKGLQALLAAQDASGFFGPTMYHHGFATLALTELYGTLDDSRIGPAIVRAVKLIQEAQEQNTDQAWRYNPQPSGADTTVTGTTLVALFAARNAGIEVPEDVIERGFAYLVSCQDASGGVGYTAPGSGSGPRNAIGVLVASLANQGQSRFARSAFSWLQNQNDAAGGSYYFYYLYYASQAYFRADMREWQRWNRQITRSLASTQNAHGGWDGPQGSTFCTATAMLVFALQYRFLPIYER